MRRPGGLWAGPGSPRLEAMEPDFEDAPGPARLSMEIHGAVQGVGFRPFVYRLATELELTGWVLNDARGVFLEVEGAGDRLRAFERRLAAEAPPLARVRSVRAAYLAPAGFERFEIRHSDGGGARTALVLPDVATCPGCLREVLDAGDRRHGYPFTNCTHCGPRFSILLDLPYDRPNTTMRAFPLCEACRREYEDPLDRRFHAQPTACAACGPSLELWTPAGEALARGAEALRGAARAVRAGQVVAVKALGGFHLVVDARSEDAVARLRERKHRFEKPFAVMVHGLEAARALCAVDEAEAALLGSPEAPIVLLRRRADAAVAPGVAPSNPYLGVMLPSTPLHHLLLAELGFPVVATSGNLSEEPICTGEREALERLHGIADALLVHDRPIARHVDDSVAWVVEGRARLLRRARGYAPLPVELAAPVPAILAVGAHQKNTVALAVGRQVFVSQHVGDLETPQALAAFERVIADFQRLYATRPVVIAHDLHPDYASTRWAMAAAAAEGGPRLVAVQHHHAHLAACLAEHGAPGPALGVSWDGTGLGTDGVTWGGEFLRGDAAAYERVAHLRPFRLPGGEAAVKEPRRVALALLFEAFGEEAAAHASEFLPGAFTPRETKAFLGMLRTGVRSPLTTSMGRLFDGVAALASRRARVRFEGQAAMELEFAADTSEPGAYTLGLRGTPGAARVLDWEPLLREILADLRRGAGPGTVAARFHGALVDSAAGVAAATGEELVALTGGCFQNRLLSRRLAERLRAAGHRVLLHEQVPPNDGGISLGQVAVAAAQFPREG